MCGDLDCDMVQAYMYGFYNSKRIVLYDTLISQVNILQ